MMLRFQCFKKAIDVDAKTHIILHKNKIFKACMPVMKINAVDFILQYIPLLNLEVELRFLLG